MTPEYCPACLSNEHVEDLGPEFFGDNICDNFRCGDCGHEWEVCFDYPEEDEDES